MSIATDVRKRGEAAIEQGKTALDDMRKPLYAVVGAGDFAVTQAVAQLKELPAETQAVVESRVKQARAQWESLRAELESRVEALRARASQWQDKAEGLKPAEFRATVDGYVSRAKEAAKETYADFAKRGEKVVVKVSERPGFRRAKSHAESIYDAVEDAVDAMAGEHKPAASKVEPPRKTAPRKTTAK